MENFNFDKAIKEVNDLLYNDNSFVSSLKEIAQANGLTNFNNLTINSNQLNRDNSNSINPEKSNNTEIIGPAGLSKISELSSNLHSSSKLLGELSNYSNQLLDNKRDFGDLLKEGPRNAAEQKLLDTAKNFMSGSELEENARKGVTVGSVITKVQDKANDYLNSMMANNNIEEKKLLEQTKEAKKRDGIDDDRKQVNLGESFGILAKLCELIAEALDKKTKELTNTKDSKEKSDSIFKQVGDADVKAPRVDQDYEKSLTKKSLERA